MSFKTPMARVTGLGAAKDGVGHWWAQRITSIALLPLTLFAIWPLAAAIGAERGAVLETYREPWNAIVAILFVAVTFRHLQQGLQVVIEDYVHDKAWLTALIFANILFCGFFGLAGVFAVAKIAFSG